MDGNRELLDCLKDIPDVMSRLIADKENVTGGFVDLFLNNPIKKIYFSGQASGIYIGMMLRHFIEDNFKMEVQITNPYEFVLHENFNVNGIYEPSQLCMICPAHSGSTPGPIEMAKICREKGIKVITTTYNLYSPLAALSDVVIDKQSGPEKSYVETRGHFASMTCIYLCFLEYGRRSGRLDSESYNFFLDSLKTAALQMPNIVSDTIKWYHQNKQLLLNAGKIRYIAAGEYVGAVLEGGLKIAETTHKSRLVYEVEEFMHSGTTEIKRDSVIFLVMPRNKTYDRMQQLYNWCKWYSRKVIVLCSFEDAGDYRNALGITAGYVPYFSVMEYILPFEVLAYLLCEDLNLSVIVSANEDNYENLKVHV